MKKLLPLITLLFVAISVNASDYDFWLNFHNCKKLVSYLEFSDDSLQIQDGDSYVMGCKRNHGRINCDLTFKDKSTNEEAYNIVIDSPPLLFMKSDSGASFLAINTTSGFAGHTTRFVHQEFLGEKVCNGIFMTEFQRKNFE